MTSNSPEHVTTTDQQPDSSMTTKRGEVVSEQTGVRCPGCDTTQRWAQFDAPPESVDAIATCPACGTHILAIETVTKRDMAELSEFFSDISRRNV